MIIFLAGGWLAPRGRPLYHRSTIGGATPAPYRTALLAYCVFCSIIAGREPAQVFYEDEEFIVFRNVLRWLPVMLLGVPKQHLSQNELWSNIGRLSGIAARFGRKFCPNGFRIVSNFGWDALQSQPHAHVHIIGGGSMDAVTGLTGPEEPVLEKDGFRIVRRRSGWPPVALIAQPFEEIDQDSFFEDLGGVGPELVRLGHELCPYGFRLAADFGWDALQAIPGGHIYLLGGTELGHYV